MFPSRLILRIFSVMTSPRQMLVTAVLCVLSGAVCSSAWFRCPSHVVAEEWGWAECGHWSQVRESLRVAVITRELQTKVKRRFAKISQSWRSDSNVKAQVGAFNQEKAVVRAFSVIVKLLVIFGVRQPPFEGLIITCSLAPHHLTRDREQPPAPNTATPAPTIAPSERFTILGSGFGTGTGKLDS